MAGEWSRMNVTKESRDGASAVTLSEEHNSWNGAKSLTMPDSPESSCVSNKARSMPTDFKNEGSSENEIPVKQEKPDSPEVSCLSMKSMFHPTDFKDGVSKKQIQTDNSASLKSEPMDKEELIVESRYEGHRKRSQVLTSWPARKHETNLDSIFMLLEDEIIIFVKNELKKLKKVLGPEYPEDAERLRDEDEVVGGEEDEQRRDNRDAFRKITLYFLRQMKQEELADSLQSKSAAAIYQRNLKVNLKKRFQRLFEGIAKAGEPTLLNQIYTELYITQGGHGEVNDQHEVREEESSSPKLLCSETAVKCEDIFRPLFDRDEPVRTLVTKGVAGIGKTVLTQKYILDWAEEKAHHHIQFIFPFTFRELNLMKEKKCSLVELLHNFFPDIKEAGICRVEDFRVLFIFDGLDECRLHLDFHNSEILTDVTRSTSVEVLLTNLIKGTLLPGACLWITTRPAAASQIPPECIDMVTEVRGFSDPQRQEYFRKKFRNTELANIVISHIEASRSLHIMCHIPIFCWISTAVLEHFLKGKEVQELPKTLTDMYIHFLLVQTKQWKEKYHSSVPTDTLWNTETKKTILTLGKLAFDHLEKGNLVFFEADLEECGINIKAASVYSGLLTEIFNYMDGLYQEKVFCFVHLSIQEFIAALYVFVTFINTGFDLLRKRQSSLERSVALEHKFNLKNFYQRAVDLVLQNQNRQLDLFVRFLLGLSLETNQTLLRGLLIKRGTAAQAKNMLVQYIKKKLNESNSPERSIYLLHCLNELNDQSLVEEIQQYLRSGRFFENKPSPSQWSALAFILLSSQEDLKVFDLKKFSASDVSLQWLHPVVAASKKAVLSSCNLSLKSCETLVSVLNSKTSNLRELDLSDNDLYDTGAMLLSAGLKIPHCRLEVLRLSGCQITENGCMCLGLALKFNPSHLRELDLSFNHPGESGVEMLSAALDDPHWKLETLRIDHCGTCRMKPSPLRYFCQFSLDPNTAATDLLLFDNNKQAKEVKEKQPYPDHPERFSSWTQVLCTEGLTGRRYWEVRWNGRINMGVTYRGIERRGNSDDCCIGRNDQSWGLSCSAEGYTAWHNNRPIEITQRSSCGSNWVGVYLDWTAGTVSFYCFPSAVSCRNRIHLYTFHSTFTKPLYPAFGFGRVHAFGTDSELLPCSLYLSQIGE